MATPAKPTGGETPKDQEVQIYVETKTKTITVKPDPFYVSIRNLEQAMWTCKQQHKHEHGKCFSVSFSEETPFSERTFEDHEVRSGLPVVQADEKKLYKYAVTVPGVGLLDPKGGVTP